MPLFFDFVKFRFLARNLLGTNYVSLLQLVRIPTISFWCAAYPYAQVLALIQLYELRFLEVHLSITR